MVDRNKLTRCVRICFFFYTLTIAIARFAVQYTDIITDKHIPPLFFFTIQTLLLTTLHFFWNSFSASPKYVAKYPRLFGPSAAPARIIFLLSLTNMTITVVLYWILLAEEHPVYDFLSFVSYVLNISYHGIHIIFLWTDLLIDANIPLNFTSLDLCVPPTYVFCFVMFMSYVKDTRGYWIYPAFAGELKQVLLFCLPIATVIIEFIYIGLIKILQRLPYYRYTIRPSSHKNVPAGSEDSTFNLNSLFSAVSRDMSDVGGNEGNYIPPKSSIVRKV